MSRVRIAVQIHPQQGSYGAIHDALKEAEELGVDIAYNWDHFYPLYGDPDGRHFEAWTMLGAWAEQTERIEIGPLVTCNSYRNPQLLADMARTVDHISDGRLIFGIGSGWFERDYNEYGYEFGTAVSRLRDLGSALPLIEQRWEKLNPAPTRKIPVLIGGGGEKVTLRLTARHADVWHFFPKDPEAMAHKMAILDGWCEKEGRSPGAIERSAGVHPHLLDKGLAEADEYVDLGVRQFTLGVGGPEFDLGSVPRWLEWRDRTNERLAG